MLLATNGRLGLEPFLRGGWQAFGWVLGETLINVSAVLGTLLLAGRFDNVGPWDSTELYFMLGFVLLARGIANVFSGRQVLMISRKIGRGQMDHLLVQPIPLWKALAAEGFSPFDLLATLVLGAGTLVWSIASLPHSFGPLWYAMLLLNLASAVCVIVSYQFLWGALAFWSPRGAEEVNTASASALGGLSAFPLDAAPKAVLGILVTVVPVGFIGWIPARELLAAGTGFRPEVLLAPAAALLLALLSITVFKKGLRRYEKFGSGRYSDFGHRR
ncbi:ABC-2 family transporter protein [Glycomyces rhizosphaerae]|uniref:ABC-2 family transporter protein n=1 Tax=Glycomyces rhizosphaerae TaxID=2054422 RepID=A0ABV7Q632_9ACTN